MGSIADAKGTVASKLTLVCALALAASTFANDAALVAPGEAPLAIHKPLDALRTPNDLASVPGLFEMIEWMNTFFDQAHRAILAESVPKALMLHQPFAMIAEILGRALQEIKPLKDTGELGPGGDDLIYGIADARYKADRNSNLIRQMTVEPRTFVSTIDRDGLVAMARIAADAHPCSET